MTNFQRIIIIFILTITLFIWYYFLSILPKQNSEKLELQREELRIKEEQIQKENEIKENMEASKYELEQEKLCIEKWEQLKKKYNNIVMSYYNSLDYTCYVKYDQDGQTLEWPIDWMQTTTQKPIINPIFGEQTIIQDINLREYAPNGSIIQVIDVSNKVSILSYKYIKDDLWYEVNFNGTVWWISSIAFWQ